MKRAVIGCSMIKEDIQPILDNITYDADIIWLDETLHNVPKNLTAELQKTIDSLSGYDEIILTYLLCGNALIGIHSENAPIRFIKGDDCIYACMCGREDYKSLRAKALFLSHGWLQSGRNPITDYEDIKKKYGEKRARYIYDVMYKNYKEVVYMKREGEEVSAQDREKAENFASFLNLNIEYLQGSTGLYEKLLNLEDDPKIAVVPAGQEITLKNCGIFG